MRIDDSQLWSGLIGLALGAIVVWQGYEHDIGVVTEPGTGFVLFYVGWLIQFLLGYKQQGRFGSTYGEHNRAAWFYLGC